MAQVVAKLTLTSDSVVIFLLLFSLIRFEFVDSNLQQQLSSNSKQQAVQSKLSAQASHQQASNLYNIDTNKTKFALTQPIQLKSKTSKIVRHASDINDSQSSTRSKDILPSSPVSINGSQQMGENLLLTLDRELTSECLECKELHNDGGNFMLFESEIGNKQLNEKASQDDAYVKRIINSIRPELRNTYSTGTESGVPVSVALRAWQLMRLHAVSYVRYKVDSSRKQLDSLLNNAKVSKECKLASHLILDRASQFELWALQLLSSWGSLPASGFFEGSLNDVGSWNDCVNVPENKYIKHAHYCSISYIPVMPSKKDLSVVLNPLPDRLLHAFDNVNAKDGEQDAAAEFLKGANYNYYVHIKVGGCFPIDCSPIDVQKIALQIGKTAILATGSIKCSSLFKEDYEFEVSLKDFVNTTLTESLMNETGKSGAEKKDGRDAMRKLKISNYDVNHGIFIWKPHITNGQIIASAIVIILTSFIIICTLIHIFVYILPEELQVFKFEELKQQDNVVSKVTQLEDDKKQARCCDINLSKHNFHKSRYNHDAVPTSIQQHIELTPICSANNNIISRNKAEPNCLFDDHNNNDRYASGYDNDDTINSDSKNYDNFTIQSTNLTSLVDTSPNSVATVTKKPVIDESVLQVRDKFNIITEMSIITNCRQFFTIDRHKMKREITCMYGIRTITMVWIILSHTMQYNEWSAFGRTKEIEKSLRSWMTQPIFNGTYLVDVFFLMSGILTSYVSFIQCKGLAKNFSVIRFITQRYLRLTPQVMLVTALFMIIPLLGQGPHWYSVTGLAAEHCETNWWMNLFYIQSFYKTDKMCNYVNWWLSIDMFYHISSILAILLILHKNHWQGLVYCCISSICYIAYQSHMHYELELPPNLLATIPQIGKMWTDCVIKFFWSPYVHAYPFFLGFYIGYLLDQKTHFLKTLINQRKASIGMVIATSCMLITSLSTHSWVVGEATWSRIGATLYYTITPIIWSTSLCWIIVTCHLGRNKTLNRFLSCNMFIIIGRSSYIIYLSHFIVIAAHFGSQSLLIEPTMQVMGYIIIGNICLSTIFGAILVILFERPWLKLHWHLTKRWW